MDALSYLLPAILLVIVGAMVWAIRKIRTITTTSRRSSRTAEQNFLASVGIVPPGWADDTKNPSSDNSPAGVRNPATFSAGQPGWSAVRREPPLIPPPVPWAVPADPTRPPGPTSPPMNDQVSRAAQALSAALRAAANAVEEASKADGTPAQRAERVATVATSRITALPIAGVLEAGLRPPA